MAERDVIMKMGLDIEQMKKSMESVEQFFLGMPKIITDGSQQSEKTLKGLADFVSTNLGKAFNDAGKKSQEFLEGTAKGIENISGVLEKAKGLLNGWGTAFTRISVFKEAFSGVGNFIGDLIQAPKEMENAMAQLTFISKDVKNNYNDVRDSLLAMGRDMPIKSTAQLAQSMKDCVADGYNLQDSLLQYFFPHFRNPYL